VIRLSQRSLFFWATTTMLGAGLVPLLGVYAWNWHLGLGAADRSTRVGAALGIAGCVLAFVAAVAALAAYMAASGVPDLDVEVRFPFSEVNLPHFRAADDQPDGNSIKIEPYKQGIGTLTIRNQSSYSAKNPGIRVKLVGILGFTGAHGWTTTAFGTTVGVTEIQWDGGSDQMIHGRWTRVLPEIDLREIRLARAFKDPRLEVTLVADGIRPKTVAIPMRIRDPRSAATETPA
jgi:hypothetical protein